MTTCNTIFFPTPWRPSQIFLLQEPLVPSWSIPLVEQMFFGLFQSFLISHLLAPFCCVAESNRWSFAPNDPSHMCPTPCVFGELTAPKKCECSAFVECNSCIYGKLAQIGAQMPLLCLLKEPTRVELHCGRCAASLPLNLSDDMERRQSS